MAKRSTGKKWEKNKVLSFLVMFPCFILFMVILYGSNRYNFTDAFLFPLWYVALAIGIAVAAWIVFRYIRKEHGVGKCIGIFLSVTFLTFFISGLLLAHINFFCDPHEPVPYTATVVDKHRRGGGRRRMTRYKVTLDLNGETLALNISGWDFNRLDIGDEYTIEYRQGAFDEPFWIGVSPNE